jgi:orotate phosphoribosyltransferase
MLSAYDAAELLLGLKAVIFRPTNPIRFESGLLSPIYVDCRVLPSHPRERSLVAASLAGAFRDSGAKSEVVVGAGTSSVWLGECVSRHLGLPMSYVRRGQKAHGLRKRIEGASVDDRQVLLIADIICTGAEISHCVEAVRSSGGIVTRCETVFDMELDEGKRSLAEHKLPYHSLTKLTDLLNVAEIKKFLMDSEKRLVEDWQSSPAVWDQRRRMRLDDAARRIRRSVADTLVRTMAVQIRTDPPFVYSAGGKGPIYTDNRALLAHPQERGVIVDMMAELVVTEIGIRNIDCIGAVATAGIPHASALADYLNLPMVIVHSAADDHGLGRQIEGDLEKGTRVLLLEDLVNQGASTLSAAKCLREAGAVVSTCMAVFTYGLKAARERFAGSGLSLVALTDLDSLLEIGVENASITSEQQRVVQKWAVNPQAWRGIEEGEAGGKSP